MARKKPVGLRIALELLPVGAGEGDRVGVACANSPGVTLLTILSVVCADRTVATSSSNGLVKSSSQCASGWIDGQLAGHPPGPPGARERRLLRVDGEPPVAARPGRRTGAVRAASGRA